MGTDFCPQHQRFFDPADGCTRCIDEEDEMLSEEVEQNRILYGHIGEALCVKLFVDQVDSPFLMTEAKFDRERGAVYFRWNGRHWRVDDRYHVEVEARREVEGGVGFLVDDSCVLLKLLLKKCGEVAQIKRDLVVVRKWFEDRDLGLEVMPVPMLNDILKEG